MTYDDNIRGKHLTIFYPDTAVEEKPLPVVFLHSFEREGNRVIKAYQDLEEAHQAMILVSIDITDWDKDMSPWPHPAIYKKEPLFPGGADDYLKDLVEGIVPETLERIRKAGFQPAYQVIAGYSLAGLFALYSLYQTNIFSRCVSASGSMWYTDMISYVKEHTFPGKVDRIYFSLGDKEKETRNIYMKEVENATLKIKDYIHDLGIQTTFVSNPGNHFKDPEFRVAKGIAWILQ